MHVSVEVLEDLNRRVTIAIPASQINDEVNLRLQDLAKKIKLDGFRVGKVPLSLVKGRFTDDVHKEIMNELWRKTLPTAVDEQKLSPVGAPFIEFQQAELGKDFIYTAKFEILPEIDIIELDNTPVEKIQATVLDADVDNTIEELREKNKDWQEVSRPVISKDKVIIDFQGLIDGVPFPHGSAQDQELIIGSATMIPGFEEGILGATVNEPIDVKVTFPKNYHETQLAEKEAVFKITVKKIMEGHLPPLDQVFAAKFNIKDGDINVFRDEIKENMERELERQVSLLNREKVYDALLAVNNFLLPSALIEEEIAQLKHAMYHQIFGQKHSDDEKIPDFPRELFEDKAIRRVQIGLLFSAYVKKHALVADEARIEGLINKFAGAYEDQEQFRSWYKSNKQVRDEVVNLALEEVVVEKICEHAKLKEKKMTYKDVINYKPKKSLAKDKE